MRVQFHKTDDRRYGIVILRDGHEPLRMRTAPGNDPLMPHDLQHLIVEQELGIRLGIFGQVAAGGTSGERKSFDAPTIARINAQMEKLSRQWAATAMGSFLEVQW